MTFPWTWIVLIAIPALGGALLLKLVTKPLQRHEQLLSYTRFFLLALYVAIIITATLLTRPSGYRFRVLLSPFWSYRRAFSMGGGGLFPGLSIADSRILKQIVLNILLYVPFGYLLPFAWPRILTLPKFSAHPRLRKGFQAFPWVVVFTGTALSLMTEVAQLVFKRGFFEFDDLFNNTLGCLIGVLLYLMFLKPKRNPTV